MRVCSCVTHILCLYSNSYVFVCAYVSFSVRFTFENPSTYTFLPFRRLAAPTPARAVTFQLDVVPITAVVVVVVVVVVTRLPLASPHSMSLHNNFAFLSKFHFSSPLPLRFSKIFPFVEYTFSITTIIFPLKQVLVYF